MTARDADAQKQVPPEKPAPEAPPSPSAADGAAASPEAAPAPDRTVALEAQVAALEDRLRRQQAEFANQVKQIRKTGEDAVRFAAQPLLSDLLGVVDALHNAIEGLKDSEHERRVAEGLRLVERELLEVLRKHGVERVDAAGRLFDPQVHEAISELETDAPERKVLHVLSPGFTLHGRLVRAARVVVNRPKAPAAPAGTDGE